jgi:hypothetical protein
MRTKSLVAICCFCFAFAFMLVLGLGDAVVAGSEPDPPVCCHLPCSPPQTGFIWGTVQWIWVPAGEFALGDSILEATCVVLQDECGARPDECVM